MIKTNPHFNKLQTNYLFVEIARRVERFIENNPDVDLIKLGIGDVTLPLPQLVVDAYVAGARELADERTFRGYGPEQGYAFLREAIAEVDYKPRGCPIEPHDIFISDGAKCDTGNFQELFSTDVAVAVADPVYPVYVDSNVMAGRTGMATNGRFDGITYLPATAENGYVAAPPNVHVDLVYLCYPNNPTGSVATRDQLAEWVDYAREHEAILLFDAAYECFIRDESIPHSIYEISGADRVAVEFRSLSKTAGFTGTRCAYTVVPRAITVGEPGLRLHDLWNRRQATKFNGVSYPVQRAAEAVFTPAGQQEVRRLSDYYLENAGRIRSAFEKLGYTVSGGINSPYVWVASGGDSWEYFDRILRGSGVVVTPGVGFGPKGEGHIRISGFNSREAVDEALSRISSTLTQAS